MDVVGARFLGGLRCRLEAKKDRQWRLYTATTELLGVGSASPQVMSKWLGHAVNHLMLLRPGPSIFGRLYSFIQGGPWDSWRKLSTLELDEFRIVRGLIHLCCVDLGAPHATSPSQWLSAGPRSVNYVIRCDRYLERWRFVDVEAETPEGDERLRGWTPSAMAPSFEELAAGGGGAGEHEAILR